MEIRRSPGRPRDDEPPAPSQVVNVKIPLQLLERLEALARARGIPRHQAIREAIAEWVERRDHGQAEPGTSTGDPA